ncbi:nuclease-related domain-containing protein [Calidifontibacillus oryziterrae]|uniref:nuclease-related domain-containing protein n=1 Tax=Calidifontibacillus oryziterrae TaxID=1191699 RepID=UPI0002FC566D|nr:nuclease-related domain-containing protein [Calidifontibacillus oryziterrae]
MLLKSRLESNELLALRYLSRRMELTEKEKYHYLNLEKGYEGELQFDLLAKSLKEERYIINDLLLEVNNNFFQIDCLMISQGVIHILDIKNYHGDCYFEANKLYSVATKREYKNPIDQLNRSANLFRQFLQNLRQNFLVEASVIFINPEFTLYHASMDKPFIFPTQVNRFLEDLNKTPSKLNESHKKLAQSIVSLHKTENPFTSLPKYNYEQLHKGIYCNTCKSFKVYKKNNILLCSNCGGKEKIETAILRSAREFMLLFPEQKVTTQSIYDWCNLDVSKRTICRILKKNYTTIGSTNNTYYQC